MGRKIDKVVKGMLLSTCVVAEFDLSYWLDNVREAVFQYSVRLWCRLPFNHAGLAQCCVDVDVFVRSDQFVVVRAGTLLPLRCIEDNNLAQHR